MFLQGEAKLRAWAETCVASELVGLRSKLAATEFKDLPCALLLLALVAESAARMTPARRAAATPHSAVGSSQPTAPLAMVLPGDSVCAHEMRSCSDP